MYKREWFSSVLVNLYKIFLLVSIITIILSCLHVSASHDGHPNDLGDVDDGIDGRSSLKGIYNRIKKNKNNNNNNNNNNYQRNAKDYHPDFLVLEIEEGKNGRNTRDEAFQVARRIGLSYHGKVGSLDNLYLFKRTLLAEDVDGRDNNNSIIRSSQNTLLWSENPMSNSKAKKHRMSSSNRYKDIFSRRDYNDKKIHTKIHIGDKGFTKRKRRHAIKRRSIIDIADELIISHPSIKSVKPQVPLRRSRRDGTTFNDPYYPKQWNIHGRSVGGKISLNYFPFVCFFYCKELKSKFLLCRLFLSPYICKYCSEFND